MRKTTAEEKLVNILVARAMLDDLPNEKIVHGLCQWINDEMIKNPNNCGAAACFGGWVALHPYFRKVYGIRSARGDGDQHAGAPRTRSLTDSDELSTRLFGVCGMFYSNDSRTTLPRPRSDRAEIKARLQFAFNQLSKEL